MTGGGAGMGIGFALAGTKAGENADSVANAIQGQIADDNKAIDEQNRTMGTNIARVPPGVCSPNAPAAVVSRYSKACSVLQDDVDKRDSDKTLATAGIVIGVVGLATTITAYLATSKSSTSKASNSRDVAQAPRAVIVPVIGAHESGFQIVGRF